MDADAPLALGATAVAGRPTQFVVWAPGARSIELIVESPPNLELSMPRTAEGYAHVAIDGLGPGARYWFRLDGERKRPDPASRSQPDGVHGSSEVIDPSRFEWHDAGWKGRPMSELVIYELHVGTFTSEGTFGAVIERLDALRELGITAVEIMPVSQFPGDRNWGYDGVLPFAVQNTYGGLPGLQQLVDACHQRGLAVVLDVVYNHLGPEGNFLPEFGPYFTDRYQTPWGQALNFDGPESDHVRRYFLDSASYLLTSAHLDGLRVDAVHAIVDPTAHPFVAELTALAHQLGQHQDRTIVVIAESSDNDPRLVRPEPAGGMGFDAVWNDDLHHTLHHLLTGEKDRYYADYGGLEDLRTALTEAFVLSGRYSAFRRRRHGAPAIDLPPDRFVVGTQNHDQVGNRGLGERLAALVPFEAVKLAAGVVLLSPFVPLVFMGEEYGETAPFLYFASHTDPALAEAVRRGRRAEFSLSESAKEIPDPQSEGTFERSRIHFEQRLASPHRHVWDLYRDLLRFRTDHLGSRRLDPNEVTILSPEVLVVHRKNAGGTANVALFNLGAATEKARVPASDRPWDLVLASADARRGGPGTELPATVRAGASREVIIPPHSFALYLQNVGTR
jgi:maltooligosyltrehalose trehalohydrolase